MILKRTALKYGLSFFNDHAVLLYDAYVHPAAKI